MRGKEHMERGKEAQTNDVFFLFLKPHFEYEGLVVNCNLCSDACF